ncbi:MAG: lysylphosphatidylglycerol synthase domain-containing protein [Flavitalea sp.]
MFCILIYSIHHQLQQQNDWQQSLNRIIGAISGASTLKLIAVCLLMLVNWALEARKWQIAIQTISPVSFVTAYKSIFSGATMAFFTPNRTGEYIGRMLHIDEESRVRSIGITILCSIAQLTITLVCGIIGLLFLRQFIVNGGQHGPAVILLLDILVFAIIPGTIILTIFYFRLSWLVRWMKKMPKVEKYITYIRGLDSVNATLLLRILSLSLIRYLVFVVQYYFLFQVFEVEINWWQSFWSVSVLFLALAIIPTIAALTELGIRWKASLEILTLFSGNVAGILATSLAIWIINLVVPALIGCVLILGLRIFRK